MWFSWAWKRNKSKEHGWTAKPTISNNWIIWHRWNIRWVQMKHIYFYWKFIVNDYMIVSFKSGISFVQLVRFCCVGSTKIVLQCQCFLYLCDVLTETLSEMYSTYTGSWFKCFLFFITCPIVAYANSTFLSSRCPHSFVHFFPALIWHFYHLWMMSCFSTKSFSNFYFKDNYLVQKKT